MCVTGPTPLLLSWTSLLHAGCCGKLIQYSYYQGAARSLLLWPPPCLQLTSKKSGGGMGMLACLAGLAPYNRPPHTQFCIGYDPQNNQPCPPTLHPLTQFFNSLCYYPTLACLSKGTCVRNCQNNKLIGCVSSASDPLPTKKNDSGTSLGVWTGI